MEAGSAPTVDVPVVDMPVAVAVGSALREEIVAWFESDLGWQVVSGTGALPAHLSVTDDLSAAAGAVVVIGEQPSADREAALLRRGLRAGALDVVVWPRERDRIAAIGASLPAVGTTSRHVGAARGSVHVAGRGSASGPRVLRIGGNGGGVGTSTVVLALAAWAGWHGMQAVVAGDDDLLALAGLPRWTGPGTREISALPPEDAQREMRELSTPLPGVRGVRVLGGGGRHMLVPDGAADVVLLDVRAAVEEADVVVAAPGRRLADLAHMRSRLLVRLVDAVGAGEARRILGGRPRGWIPDDPRVRRAGLAGRTPSALPGRWLRDLGTGAGVGGGR